MKPHGTESRYHAEQKAGEGTCPECREAHRQYRQRPTDTGISKAHPAGRRCLICGTPLGQHPDPWNHCRGKASP